MTYSIIATVIIVQIKVYKNTLIYYNAVVRVYLKKGGDEK